MRLESRGNHETNPFVERDYWHEMLQLRTEEERRSWVKSLSPEEFEKIHNELEKEIRKLVKWFERYNTYMKEFRAAVMEKMD